MIIHYTMTGIHAGAPFCGVDKSMSTDHFQHMGYGTHPADLCQNCRMIADAPDCNNCGEILLFNIAKQEYYCDCKA